MVARFGRFTSMLFKQKFPLTGVLFNSLLTFTLLLQIVTVSFSATEVLAETRYVKPSSEIAVRRGQGNKYKIISMVKDGTAVEFLEEGETHAKIRLANDKEGWVLKRFLSVEPPLEEVVTSLRTQNQTIRQKEIETSRELDAVNETLNQTGQTLNATLRERDQFKEDYRKLQEETEDVIQLKINLEKTLKDHELLSRQMAVLQQENDTIKNDYAFKWFLAGGGVLVFGMLIGSIFSRSHKRKPSLL